jgi:SAM-dependent methyltransferase
MDGITDSYYRRDLALVHHRGYAFHADACAPGIAALLESVRERDGLVVEVGCGSGLLTRHLLDAGHRVVATDASPAMLELTRQMAPDADDVRQITLPDDPIPPAEAIVGVGHALNGPGASSRSACAISNGRQRDETGPARAESRTTGRSSPSSPFRRRTASSGR